MDYDQEKVFSEIRHEIESNDVVIYMKGEPEAPMCGFSGFVAQVMQHYDVPFKGINVLEDPVIRQAIKDYNNWPTVPQIFVKGEFIGGCDILKEMHESGELEEVFAPLRQ